MSTKNYFEQFTNLYKVQKTLRFALKPIGETLEHIKKAKLKGENEPKNLLKVDEIRAENYKKAKKIIDEFHKDFINQRLSGFSFEMADLEKFQIEYDTLKKDKSDAQKKKLAKEQDNLRKTISDTLTNSRLFKKEFIKEDLPKWLEENPIRIEGIENPKKIIQDFNGWTTYFGGFNENRKNIYTAKHHSTSIGYRLIHENLPKFIDNINRYNKAKKLGVDFSEVERNFDIGLDEIFTLKYFNPCLTQGGIDAYNAMVGGVTQEDGTKIQGINEKINLFAQQLTHRLAQAEDEDKKILGEQIRKVRSCKLEELYKQILSDRSKISFRLNEIKNDGELCQLIQNLFRINNNEVISKEEFIDKETGEIIEEEVNITDHLEKSFRRISEADHPDQLYIRNDRALTDISQTIFGNWTLIGKSLKFYAENEKLGKNKKGDPKKITSKEQETWLKQNYFSFGTIHKALEFYFNQFDANELDKEQADTQNNADAITTETKELAENKPLFAYFKSLEKTKKNQETNAFEKVSLLESVKSAFQPALEILKKYENEGGEKLKNEKKDVEKIKIYLDALMDLLHFLKPLYVELSRKDEKKAEVFEKDTGFYDDFDKAYNSLKQIIPLYNQTRNHLTKKPYSVEKYKLNFDNSTLAAGWDKNKETANTAVILLKDGKYFLAIMTKEYNKLFQTEPETNTVPMYQKMDYKLLPGASKMLPKVFFSRKNINYYSPSKEVLHIRNHGTHTKNGNPQKGYLKHDFDLKDCRKMVDFFKASILNHPEWKDFKFQFSQTNSYESIDEFYREVEQQGYKITFSDISESYIDECVTEGKLYLFEIYSKDFSKHSKGKPNLQTLYWKEIFSERNLKDVVYKLNGEAELFFRKASIQYPDIVWKEGHHKNDPLKKQKYPIIKDRRYAKDTFLFHCPVTCNFKTQGIFRFNDKVNTFLKNNPDVNILGIDRGERHLAYYTLINQKREIIKQGSFNNPQGTKDYHDLLDKREKERDNARKSWGTIEKIKDLKAGYLSQVVHEIAKLVVEHNAIVVFEDLNFGFKRGRFKVEKQIYQKLEKALIDKLNYLVFKDKNPMEAGGVLHGLQLTAPFESFTKIGKQTGIIFYVPAYHTSKVCPASGFVNLLYPRYETSKKSQEFFKKFDEIKFNSQDGYFEFKFNYKNFTNKAEGSRQKWTLYTYGERLENFRNPLQNNQWDTKKVKLTEAFKKLFKEYAINFTDVTGIKEQIGKQTEGEFFRQLIRLLKLTLQLRNSRINSDEDWMISPVKDKNGKFFDSREYGDENNEMPKNADANGAYHIGLKGLWGLEQINKQKEGEELNIAITNKEWYQFIQEKKYGE